MIKDRLLKSRLISPDALLLIQAAAVLLAFTFYPQLKGVYFDGDSRAYMSFFNVNAAGPEYLRSLFTLNFVTVGYPLFLKAAQLLTPNLKYLPLIQYAIYAAAVFLFMRGLRAYGFSKWTAFAAASATLYAKIALTSSRYVMTDCLGATFMLAGVSFLFMLVRKPRSAALWTGFLLSFFGAYMVRPIYLYLIPLGPFLGALLYFFNEKPRLPVIAKKRISSTILFSVSILALSLLPMLGFCTFKKAVTGSFSFQSQGGNSLIGVTGQLLTPDIIPLLPARVQPLAFEMQSERMKRHFQYGFTDFHDVGSAYKSFELNYNRTHAKLAIGACNNLYPGGGCSYGLLNSLLSEMSVAVIKLKPAAYARIVWATFRRGAIYIWKYDIYMTAITILMLISVFISIAASLFHRSEKPSGAPLHPPLNEPLILFLLALMTFTANFLLVSLSSTPLLRYVFAAGTFIPAFVAATGVRAWQKIPRKTKCSDSDAI